MRRRALLQTLTIGSAGLRRVEQVAAQLSMPAKSKSKGPAYVTAPQFKLLSELCELIIPADEHGGGAVEAGAPEFIDLLASENADYGRQISGGLIWLDSWCLDRYGKIFLNCAGDEKSATVDSIAYSKNAAIDARLEPGIAFFAFLRDLTLDGFFTSRIGIDYLQFRGNAALTTFPGCPTLPKS